MRSEAEPHLQMHTRAKCEGTIPRQCTAQSPGTPCLYLNIGSQAMLHTHSKKTNALGKINYTYWKSNFLQATFILQ